MADRRLLGSLAGNPDLDRWVVVRADGTILVRSGKVELGQGIRTALTAIAADELRRSLGAGEATTDPTPAAIANAVFQATLAELL